MRLDLFLKDSRIIKRRTIAKEFCERGLVKVNDKIAKPSFEIKGGETITIKFGNNEFSIISKVDKVGKKERASYDVKEPR
ncbi:MAG: RNA-binding S4 domain-containing protein [Bacilli bacterium]|nr:RNA-binding S4 domain-containing protein [Bacilli bacterium]